jgi:8-oxo-dGTP pyrophosphatase MutT (NUDIX family)
VKPSLLSAGPATGGSLDDAIGEIEAASCSDEAASAARREMLAFVDTHPDALHRSCVEAHLTGSAIVIDDSRERTLLMLHAKIGKWLQPGGHADGEGHLGTVALTEALEETGIEGLTLATPAVDCDVHVIPARPKEPEHRHLDLRYLVVAPPDAVVVGNHESHELRWVTMGELESLAQDRSLVRLARAGFEAAREL